MYSINLAYKQKKKKITLPKTISQSDLLQLITSSFRLNQKVIGLTDSKGQLITIDQIRQKSFIHDREVLYLITTQDVNDDTMSFASDHCQGKRKQFPKDKISQSPQDKKFEFPKDKKSQLAKDKKSLYLVGAQISELPQKLEGFYQGVIGDLQLFESLFLEQNLVTIVFCFVKQKPKNIAFPYYLYHTRKNSAIIYQGLTRVCQFFIEQMNQIPKQIESFVQSLSGQQVNKQLEPQNPFLKIKNRTETKQEGKIFHNQNKENKQLFDHQINLESENKQSSIEEEKFQQFQEQQESEQQQALLNNSTSSQEQQPTHQTDQQKQIQASLLQNLIKLKDDGDITQLQFYKMKSQLLQNFSDFMRKYQMGTRKGLRRYRNQPNSQRNSPQNKNQIQEKQQLQQKFLKRPKERQKRFLEEKEKIIKNTYEGKDLENIQINNQTKKHMRKYQNQSRESQKGNYYEDKQHYHIGAVSQPKTFHRSAYSRQHRRNKKYEIPIIVRKYNNVIQKISTSYPLTQEQQQSINLILQLQLKGLISEKQSGIYKTSILQQDHDVFSLFLDYFDNLIDQLQLVSRLKKIKKINSQNKQRSQHNMRLLIKHSKQQNYELLRNLLLEKNHLLLATFDRFKNDKNSEKLAQRLEKIAIVYRQKQEIEEDVLE